MKENFISRHFFACLCLFSLPMYAFSQNHHNNDLHHVTSSAEDDAECQEIPPEREPGNPDYKPIKILLKDLKGTPQIGSPFCLYDHKTGVLANYPPNSLYGAEPAHPCISNHDHIGNRIWVLANDVIDIPSHTFYGSETYDKNKKESYASFRVLSDGSLTRAYGSDYGTGEAFADTVHITRKDEHWATTCANDQQCSEISPHFLHAKATYLRKVSGYNCAYYRVDVDPSSFPYDPKKNNGIYFALSAVIPGKENVKCDDNDRMKLMSVREHFFYPTNGVFLNESAGQWIVTPLKQSVILELPYDSESPSFSPIKITLNEMTSGIHYGGSNYTPHWGAEGLKSAAEFYSQEQQNTNVAECLKKGKVTYDITKKPSSDNYYFTNRIFAIPVSVSLLIGDETIKTTDETCGFLYDHLAFFLAENKTIPYYPVTNNIFSEDAPFAYLPEEYVEMAEQNFGAFPKYSRPDQRLFAEKSETGKNFYFYSGPKETQLFVTALVDNLPITTTQNFYLNQGRKGLKAEILWDKKDGNDLKNYGHNGRDFYLSPMESPHAIMSDPNMQRLDYVAGLENINRKKILPGIFYNMFGGVLNNCEDAVSTDDDKIVYHVLNSSFGIICKNSIVGYLGYVKDQKAPGGETGSPRKIGRIITNPLSPSMESTGRFIINDSHAIIANNASVNRLVLFDTNGTPYLYQEDKTDTRATNLNKNECKYGHLYVNNNRNKPLVLWISDASWDNGKDVGQICDTSLGNYNNTVNPPGSACGTPSWYPSPLGGDGNEYTYVAPGAQILIDSENNNYRTKQYFAIEGSYEFDITNPFSFQFNNGIWNLHAGQQYSPVPSSYACPWYYLKAKFFYSCYFISNYVPSKENYTQLRIGVNTAASPTECNSEKPQGNYQQLFFTDPGASVQFKEFYGDGRTPNKPYKIFQ